MNNDQRISKGQTMLFMVFTMSIVILGATSLANLLVIYELKQSSSVTQSTQALFSADAGIERILMRRFGCGVACLPEVEKDEGELYDVGDIGQRFKIYKKCSDIDKDPIVCPTDIPRNFLIEKWYSVGKDLTGQTVRTLEITFTEQI
jgi:hypothetical protein